VADKNVRPTETIENNVTEVPSPPTLSRRERRKREVPPAMAGMMLISSPSLTGFEVFEEADVFVI